MKTDVTKIRTLLMLLLVLAACAADVARAQQEEAKRKKPAAAEPAKLFADIERVFREKEPAWEVERVTPGPEPEPARHSFVFRSAEGQAAVDVSVWKKERDARDVFAAEAKAFDLGPGRAREKSSLPRLGDENHVWKVRGSGAWPMLRFRQGTVNVTVFAPSTAVAERFARRVLERLNAE